MKIMIFNNNWPEIPAEIDWHSKTIETVARDLGDRNLLRKNKILFNILINMDRGYTVLCTTGTRSRIGSVGFCWPQGADGHFGLVLISDTEITLGKT